jgi:asparagine synthase (glutamine-hydrolysing)
VPFLDHRLVHKAINLPLQYRIGTLSDKWILKQVAERYVPSNLVHRKKKGFPLPLADYVAPFADRRFFNGGFCQEALGLNGRGFDRLLESWQRWTFAFFGLVTLEIWGRIFLRRERLEVVQEWLQSFEPIAPQPQLAFRHHAGAPAPPPGAADSVATPSK